MTTNGLPAEFQVISAEQQFSFACHPGVSCFTECCRELDLALSPYDVLRLKNALNITSHQFLERYVIIEQPADQILPICYLTMVDDGRASCVFVNEHGCSVYPNRPGSCRAYPLGRGGECDSSGKVTESLVLLQEPHCKGFAEPVSQNAQTYLQEQGLTLYNRFNDALLPLYQHQSIRNRSFQPTALQLDQYILALYDVDQFRQELAKGNIHLPTPLNTQQLKSVAGSDEDLLLFGIKWLMLEWFDSQQR
ncbi:MAG: YkgJ family cysteine cluster protein [Desulfobulbus sp.]|nr:YkgJ family cysteine cluster protein [Desulfobulbus sp.]